MAITIDKLYQVLTLSFPKSKIEIHHLTEDDEHYHLKIISKCFFGKTRIEQHKMVYQALKECNIHAIQLETKV
ncbi:BolA/IbaG family iron-sulfur metabolism protein [Wolbachia endosymbiont of Howardula sp.]|uniref:BolA/IbaG family iron-sulfur metabolism protein n=1 Tax=Wolbachia endosymbiont of Howardula sp. TaxID=2916816 RepID=UPI00217D2934|nr:BolA/IbaG family iron-sulfur metabolism protein [Wolbachia endosymbiont of Howardula sp.]UWI83198.1 BolA/IbaG family iron-sulfur metabolism protein [Wolbachia endosymbiont of Howardula sp.]